MRVLGARLDRTAVLTAYAALAAAAALLAVFLHAQRRVLHIVVGHGGAGAPLAQVIYQLLTH